MINNFDRIRQVNDILKNDNKQSLSDILESFSCISKNYEELDKNIENIEYSNILYSKCSEEEKESFYNNQLQLIECLVTNTIYDKSGIVWDWKQIYDLLYMLDHISIFT